MEFGNCDWASKNGLGWHKLHIIIYLGFCTIYLCSVSCKMLHIKLCIDDRKIMSMDDIHYSRIRDTFALSPCVVGFALRNVREIYFLQMALGCSVFLLFAETSEFSESIA